MEGVGKKWNNIIEFQQQLHKTVGVTIPHS